MHWTLFFCIARCLMVQLCQEHCLVIELDDEGAFDISLRNSKLKLSNLM